MRVAIVDDSDQDASRLESYLQRYGAEHGLSVQARRYPSGQEFLRDYRGDWDLVIMDIDMPGLNGVEAARQLRKTDPHVVLMFVTNMPQYALCGYEVEAVDYALKPLSYPDFALKLRKAGRYILRDREEWVPIHTAEGILQLSVREILYVESLLHYLIYHTARGDYRVRGSMAEAERALQPHQFARCNNSYRVNLRHVKAIGKEEVSVAGIPLKMSRGKRNGFLDRFNRFLGGMEP